MKPAPADIGPFERWLGHLAHGSNTSHAQAVDTNKKRASNTPDHNEALDWLTRQLRWEFTLAQLAAAVPTSDSSPATTTITGTAELDHSPSHDLNEPDDDRPGR